MKISAYIAMEKDNGKKTKPIEEGELFFITKTGKDGKNTGQYNARKHLGSNVQFVLKKCLIEIIEK